MSLFRTCALATLSVALLADQTSAATAPYCVREIPVSRKASGGLAAQSQGPTKFLFGGEAATPLAIDEVREPADQPGRYYVRKIIWSFGADGRFHGPNSITTFETDGTDGRYIYLSTHRQLSPQKGQNYSTKWDSHFYYVENGGEPREIALPLAGLGAQYLLHRHAMPGDGPVITSSVEKPGKAIDQQQWLVQGGRVAPVAYWLAYPQYRFDRWGLGVGTAADQVYLRDLRTGAHIDVDVSKTEDIGGIESVNVDRYGWLFVENWGSDYAIKWHHERGSIAVDRVIRFTGRGFWGRLFAWLLGMDRGMRVDETHWSAQCVNYSPVLQLTIFCKPHRVLRNGELARFGDNSAPLSRYIGDAAGARVALFAGKDGSLYAFNGEITQLVARGVGLFPKVQDLPAAGRTFISGRETWELRGRFPRLRLRAVRFSLSDPADVSRFSRSSQGVRFLSYPGTRDVIAFSTLLGAWRLGEADASLVWRTRSAAIDPSSMAPAAVWKGLIFSTTDRRNYLLSKCG